VLALLGVSLLISAACATDDGAPSDSDCARVWNQPGNQANQQEVADSGLDQAIVYGWTVKSGDRGCSVTFVERTGAPWVTYSRLTPPSQSSAWDRIEGRVWGQDNPEGGPEEANAIPTPDGTVRLGA
jgi:hypothetical protein